MSEYPWNKKNNAFTWLRSLYNPFNMLCFENFFCNIQGASSCFGLAIQEVSCHWICINLYVLLNLNLASVISIYLSFLGGAPTSIFHFFHLSVCLSVVHLISGTRTSSDHNFWYAYLKWWYLQAFFFFFFFFIFFFILIFWALLPLVKRQKIAQNEK